MAYGGQIRHKRVDTLDIIVQSNNPLFDEIFDRLFYSIGVINTNSLSDKFFLSLYVCTFDN